MLNFIIAIIIVLIFIVFFTVKAVVLKKISRPHKSYILIPCFDDTKNLDKLVKSYYLEEILENENFMRNIILLIMDKDMDISLPLRLEKEYSQVYCVYIDKLDEFLKK